MALDDPYGRRSGGAGARGPDSASGPGSPPGQPVASGNSETGSAARGPDGEGTATGQADKPSMLPAITTPKGGGAIRGIGDKFAVAAATGTASLTVPLPISPGRSGFGPQVGLSYDSGHGNGPFGIGFALSVPTITRKTDKGLPRYLDVEESDEFILSGAEDLVPNRVAGPGGTFALDVIDRGDRVVQQYRPRVEGLFARIERHTAKADGSSHWEVTTKDNVTHRYGLSSATQIADPKDPSHVFSWLLDDSRDDRGNVVQYIYKGEDGAGVDPIRTSERSRFDRKTGAPVFTATAQKYLKRVLYGNFTPKQASDFLFELVFDYGDHLGGDVPTPADDGSWPVRIDPFSTFRAAFEVRTYRLCQRVLMFHRLSDSRQPLLVKSTAFDYEPGAAFTYLRHVTQQGYLFDAAGTTLVQKLAMPTLTLDYVRPVLNDVLSVLPTDSLDGLEGGVDGADKQWVDLDGEGIPGVLIDNDRAWYYKANAGNGQLAAPRVLSTLPSPSTLGSAVQQLQDLGGDGQMDLVAYGEPISGFASRTPDGDFDPWRTFRSVPNIDFRDPNLRVVDVDGDGLADVLISQDGAFVWYRSLAKQGFEDAQRIVHSRDEDKGPRLVFADAEQTVQLADMSGDGLVDIVRVRNGEVCYWPNLGYGHFGAKVTLDASPRFARVDEFDARRVRFGDVDGSGTSDIFYLGTTGVTLYYNQSGNGLSAPTPITSLPVMDSAGQVGVVDLLGSGTATLVWSSPLPRDAQRPVMYVDLMGGKKPHLLASIVNNLGAETQVTYAPSTKFYLADKAADTPWLTRLAFPVHVVERVDHFDRISNSQLTSTYTYHHGFFDGVEREFRGFARVEQTDAEQFTLGPSTTEFQPPTLTKSWFHTGAWLEKEALEKALAREYFRQGPATMVLPDTILTGDVTIQDEREAARALRGHMLHQEVYALDADVNPDKAALPFTVTEQSFEVRLLQTSQRAKHGVFFAFPRETITIHTERNESDPRVAHELTLAVDDFGNATSKVAVAYGRDPALAAQSEQTKPWATQSEMSYINNPGASDDPTQFYRLGLPVETTTFELTGLTLPIGGHGLLTRDALEEAIASIDPLHDLPYDVAPPVDGAVARRMLDRKQQLYYAEDANGIPTVAAVLGATGGRALPFESYQLALTAGQVTKVVGGSTALTGVAFDPTLLGFNGDYTIPQGHYAQRPGDSGYWARSGQILYDAGGFYLPIALTDSFGFQHNVVRDQFHMLIERAQDPLGNIVQAQNDYRVLAPFLVTDPNLNRVQAAFDALGMLTATAVMGKTNEHLGDTIQAPTTSFQYHLLNWQENGKPAFVHTFAREQHGATNTRFLETFSYSDGFGRLAMKKVQAEPGPVPGMVGTITPRWVGTGRTVFNNKGNPVKQYEPFFSATSDFEGEATVVQAGVTPVMHYDALDRLVRTELPNGTESRVEFDAWEQIASDPNDTVVGTSWWTSRGSPQPTDPEPTDSETRAAWLASRHAGTPTVTEFDALGRPFLIIEQNRTWDDSAAPPVFTDAFFPIRTALDVEGNALAIIDARQAAANATNPISSLTQRFDVLSRVLRTDSIDAGTRLTISDVAGKVLFRWDSRGQIHRYRYDALERPTHLFVQKTDVAGEAAQADRLLIRTIYGELLDPAGPPPMVSPPSDAQALNLRGQAHVVYDCAGKVKNDKFDFKANLLSSTRRLAQEFRTEPNWSAVTEVTSVSAAEAAADVLLDAPLSAPTPSFTAFPVLTEYDALNRVTSRTTPDLSVTVPKYNDAGLLETVLVGVRGAAPALIVANIDYNARGQRILYEYVDPTDGAAPVTCRISYVYDPFTFRLTNVVTNRLATSVVSAAKLQDLAYTYDPVGNAVELDDNADTAPFFSGTVPISGNGLFRYDSLYRLIQATGREHPGQQQPTGAFDILPSAVPHPNDSQALVPYLEKYSYDQVGNIQRVVHTSSPSATWTRNYQYEPGSNRLLSNNDPDAVGGTASYAYTGNGTMNKMAHLPAIDWDYADRMTHANRGSGGGDVFFTYDISGQRVRKVWEHGGSLDERIYVGNWETFRSRTGGITSAPTVERETLHAVDDRRRIALAETMIIGTGPNGSRWRIQLANLIDSCEIEIDAQGRVISYEEYHPYGTSAFRSFGSTELSAKRYRYTGKEREEETGLYYYGARYYAPWLGRWISTDPKYTALNASLYDYCRNNPVSFTDPDGQEPEGYYKLPGPGNQWMGYFLGAAAHTVIAYDYQTKHDDDRTYFNVHSLKSILEQNRRAGDPAKLLPGERALRPDITNITTREVYEIKPGLGRADEAERLKEGSDQLNSYLTALNRAAPPNAQFQPGSNYRGELWIQFAGGALTWRLRWETKAPGVVLYKWEKLNPKNQSSEAVAEALRNAQFTDISESELQQHEQALQHAVDTLVSHRLLIMRVQHWLGIAIDVVGIAATSVLSAFIFEQMGAGAKAPPKAVPQPGGGRVIPFRPAPAPAPAPAAPPQAPAIPFRKAG